MALLAMAVPAVLAWRVTRARRGILGIGMWAQLTVAGFIWPGRFSPLSCGSPEDAILMATSVVAGLALVLLAVLAVTTGGYLLVSPIVACWRSA